MKHRGKGDKCKKSRIKLLETRKFLENRKGLG